MALAYAGHTDQGAEQILKTLELDPDFALAYYHLGTIYSVGARLDRAVEAFESADRKSAGSLGPDRLLGCAYASVGRREDALPTLQRMEHGGGYVSPLEPAYVHAGLGDVDSAFRLLEHAVEDRSADLVRFRLHPWPASLRRDPRFEALAGRIGLPAASAQV